MVTALMELVTLLETNGLPALGPMRAAVEELGNEEVDGDGMKEEEKNLKEAGRTNKNPAELIIPFRRFRLYLRAFRVR